MNILIHGYNDEMHSYSIVHAGIIVSSTEQGKPHERSFDKQHAASAAGNVAFVTEVHCHVQVLVAVLSPTTLLLKVRVGTLQSELWRFLLTRRILI